PDIQKYVIQEKVGSGAWSKVGERPGGSVNFQKAIDKVGTYQYRVSAVRPEVAQSAWATTDPLEVTTTETTATTSGGDGGQAAPARCRGATPDAARRHPHPPSPGCPGPARAAGRRPGHVRLCHADDLPAQAPAGPGARGGRLRRLARPVTRARNRNVRRAHNSG